MTIKVYFEATEIPVKSMIFPGGEINVRLDYDGRDLPGFTGGLRVTGEIHIVANLRSSNDIFELLLVSDAVRHAVPYHNIHVTIPYFPYARQDRVCNGGEALSVKVLSNIINSQSYRSVTVWDPHSDVTAALLCNVKILEPVYFLRESPDSVWDKDTVLVAPDAGAIKKVAKLCYQLHFGIPLQMVRADKTRDTKTGALSGTVVYGDVKDKHVLIVDDICDGGYTFIQLGKELKRLGAKRVGLYITHGIFSKGVDVLHGAIDEVYCPNVWEENVLGRNEFGILKEGI